DVLGRSLDVHFKIRFLQEHQLPLKKNLINNFKNIFPILGITQNPNEISRVSNYGTLINLLVKFDEKKMGKISGKMVRKLIKSRTLENTAAYQEYLEEKQQNPNNQLMQYNSEIKQIIKTSGSLVNFYLELWEDFRNQTIDNNFLHDIMYQNFQNRLDSL
ncbi:hypothetical protein ACFLRB_04970, partial [Acidobacteriota bacterium]